MQRVKLARWQADLIERVFGATLSQGLQNPHWDTCVHLAAKHTEIFESLLAEKHLGKGIKDRDLCALAYPPLLVAAELERPQLGDARWSEQSI